MTRTVLLVEDDADVRLLVRQILEQVRGVIHVHETVDGAAGLAFAGTGKPDLVLVDLNLPDLAGIEVIRRLKSDPETRSIPVAVLSADMDDVRRELGNLVGAYIRKPFDVDEFLEAVERLLFERTCAATASHRSCP